MDKMFSNDIISLIDEFIILEGETEEDYRKRVSKRHFEHTDESEELLQGFLEYIRKNNRLHDEHLLAKEHNPITVLGYMSDSEFTDALFNLSQGKGFIKYTGSCEFVQSLGENYIKFGIELNSAVPMQREVLLDYQTVYHYLKIACDFHINRFKEDEEIVKKHLKAYRENFNVTYEDIT